VNTTTSTKSPYLLAKRAEYERHQKALTDMRDLAMREKRALSEDELRSVVDHGEAGQALYTEIEQLEDEELRNAKVAAMTGRVGAAIGDTDGAGTGGAPVEATGMYSLMPSGEQLEQMRSSIGESRSARFTTVRQPRDAREREHLRAAVTLSLVGGQINAIDGSLPEPRRLATTVGLTPHPSGSAGYSGPKFPASTPTAATAEGGTKPEGTAPTALSIAIKQLARWNTLSRMAWLSQPGMLEQFVSYHATGVALDEDKMIVDALNTAAGTAIAFSGTDQRPPVRAAMALVEATVAAACDVVICHPDNYGLLAGFDPTDADEAGGRVRTFGGGILYPSLSCPTGFVLVAALKAAGWFIVADPPSVATLDALTTNETTLRVEELVGFDVRLAGAVKKVDVVTP
jgi:hypothetical protein